MHTIYILLDREEYCVNHQERSNKYTKHTCIYFILLYVTAQLKAIESTGLFYISFHLG